MFTTLDKPFCTRGTYLVGLKIKHQGKKPAWLGGWLQRVQRVPPTSPVFLQLPCAASYFGTRGSRTAPGTGPWPEICANVKRATAPARTLGIRAPKAFQLHHCHTACLQSTHTQQEGELEDECRSWSVSFSPQNQLKVHSPMAHLLKVFLFFSLHGNESHGKVSSSGHRKVCFPSWENASVTNKT